MIAPARFAEGRYPIGVFRQSKRRNPLRRCHSRRPPFVIPQRSKKSPLLGCHFPHHSLFVIPQRTEGIRFSAYKNGTSHPKPTPLDRYL